MAVSSDGSGNRVMTSPDGITWTIRSSAADNQWNSVTYGNGLFVAVASTGTGDRVMTSPDGITWTIRTPAADNGWRAVVYGGTSGQEMFVAVGSTGLGNRVMTSASVSPTSNVNATYTGVSLLTTTHKSAPITLSATVTLPASFMANLSQLRFINRDTGLPISGWLALSGSSNTGTVSHTTALTLDTHEIFRKYNIGIEVGGTGCFTRNNSTDNVVITVADPGCGCY